MNKIFLLDDRNMEMALAPLHPFIGKGWVGLTYDTQQYQANQAKNIFIYIQTIQINIIPWLFAMIKAHLSQHPNTNT